MHEHPYLMDLIIDPSVVPHFVSYALLGSILLILVSLMVRKSLSLVPTGTQNFIEVVAKYMLDLAEETIGHHWGRPFFPLIATIFMYIAVCNFMGLIPGFDSPTSNINMTASMAVPVFLATHYYGMKVHGIGYIKHFLGPMRSLAALPLMVLMFFVESVSHLARPVTLSVRLFGNMIAKHFLLLVLGFLVPWFIPVAVLALGVLVSVVQALVFALLTTMYLAGAVEEAH
ncbi:MAG: F0F1 ATP synthase subunit A [Nitrospirota bacterium]|jgi:F-type H+-transporting ATPase subunit a